MMARVELNDHIQMVGRLLVGFARGCHTFVDSAQRAVFVAVAVDNEQRTRRDDRDELGAVKGGVDSGYDPPANNKKYFRKLELPHRRAHVSPNHHRPEQARGLKRRVFVPMLPRRERDAVG